MIELGVAIAVLHRIQTITHAIASHSHHLSWLGVIEGTRQTAACTISYNTRILYSDVKNPKATTTSSPTYLRLLICGDQVGRLGGGSSDYGPFLQHLGVSSMNVQYGSGEGGERAG